MFTSSPTGSFPPSSLHSSFHTAAYLCIYLCTTSRRIYPFLHLFSTYLRSVFSLASQLCSTNVRLSLFVGSKRLSQSSFSWSVVLQNRGIQMTSDDEYPRLSRPAGNCRYPYFCPRLRTVLHEGVQRAYTLGVGSFLPSSRVRTPLFTAQCNLSAYNLALLSSGIS